MVPPRRHGGAAGGSSRSAAGPSSSPVDWSALLHKMTCKLCIATWLSGSRHALLDPARPARAEGGSRHGALIFDCKIVGISATKIACLNCSGGRGSCVRVGTGRSPLLQFTKFFLAQ